MAPLPKLEPEINFVLERMFHEMKREMAANRELKGGRENWLKAEPKELIKEVFYHAGKLQMAMMEDNKERIREYAADVANMAMLCADRYGIFAGIHDRPVGETEGPREARIAGVAVQFIPGY